MGVLQYMIHPYEKIGEGTHQTSPVRRQAMNVTKINALEYHPHPFEMHIIARC